MTSKVVEIPARTEDYRTASHQGEEDIMEFLVEFEVIVPDATPESEVKLQEASTAIARLVRS